MAPNTNSQAWREYIAWRLSEGTNEDTANVLLERERETPGYLTVNEREFVEQLLGSEAWEGLP